MEQSFVHTVAIVIVGKAPRVNLMSMVAILSQETYGENVHSTSWRSAWSRCFNMVLNSGIQASNTGHE
jgi:hypothetical protein